MNKIFRLTLVAICVSLFFGCTTKLVRIDSKPAFAEIRINNEYIGKTPMYHRFYDRWYPWPIKKTDDYMVQAQLPGYEPEVQIFQETPEWLNISYVPDEIFFKMLPLEPEGSAE